MREEKKEKGFKARLAKQQTPEYLSVVDKYTGEVTKIPVSELIEDRVRQPKEGMVKYALMDTYYRNSIDVWKGLEVALSEKELLMVQRLAIRADVFTNSIVPIRPSSSARDLSIDLHWSKNTVKMYLDKMIERDIIKKIDGDYDWMRYYILNPYISFNGNVIHVDVVDAFKGTKYASQAKMKSVIKQIKKKQRHEG